MGATSISVPAGSPAPSSASPFPADLSHSPLLGILGVLLGAAIVTLTGRLLTLGLNVHWAILRLFGRIAGTATSAIGLRGAVYCGLRISTSTGRLRLNGLNRVPR